VSVILNHILTRFLGGGDLYAERLIHEHIRYVAGVCGLDAKQRCLPELHDVPYDTPPPTSSSSLGLTPAAAAAVNMTSHHDLMDEPIYANSAVTGDANFAVVISVFLTFNAP